MRKIMFIGRSEAGKTTLSQAMKGKTITYHKTQYVNHYDVIIDTPGEYLQSKNLISALAVFIILSLIPLICIIKTEFTLCFFFELFYLHIIGSFVEFFLY